MKENPDFTNRKDIKAVDIVHVPYADHCITMVVLCQVSREPLTWMAEAKALLPFNISWDEESNTWLVSDILPGPLYMKPEELAQKSGKPVSWIQNLMMDGKLGPYKYNDMNTGKCAWHRLEAYLKLTQLNLQIKPSKFSSLNAKQPISGTA